jgi:hypothetical protein
MADQAGGTFVFCASIAAGAEHWLGPIRQADKFPSGTRYDRPCLARRSNDLEVDVLPT